MGDVNKGYAKTLLNITNPQSAAPKFVMDTDIRDFYAFTPDSFRVEDYTPAPFDAKIPIAV